MKVRHAKPEGWIDTAETGVIQPSAVAGLVHEIELEAGDLLQGPRGDKGDAGARGPAGLNVAGMVAHFAGTSVPPGWLECNGAPVQRLAYAALFAAIGTTYGAGDGANTFNLPDLRGEFIRGADGGRGIDPGRVFGSKQADALQGHRHTSMHDSFLTKMASTVGETVFRLLNKDVYTASAEFASSITGDVVNGVPRTAKETRPTNVALLPCIATGT